jgi:hypothetical protein
VRRAAVAAIGVAVLLGAAIPAAGTTHRPKWHTRVLGLVPPPGYPARAYVAPNGRIYEGTYDNPTGDSVSSRVLEYSGRGALLRSWTVRGQDLSTDHGVQVATSDARRRLVLLDRSPPRALLLNTRTGRFRRYARFADLATCAPGQTGRSCSPTLTDQPPVPNYAAWGRNGSLYVTDYLQGVIWRVPPGGGKAKVWLADPRLDGEQFGTTGIVTTRDRRRLLFTQQSSAGGAGGDPATGKLYAVRIRRDRRPGPIRQLWESDPLDGPDGLAIARSGHVYIALAGSNQIVELGSGGDEVERFPATPQIGDNGSSVPFDTPSSVMFRGTRLIVANQAFFSGDPSHQAILDVEAGERGLAEFIPRTAGVRRRHR